MCPMHSEAKQTEMLEFVAEQCCLLGPRKEMVARAHKISWNPRNELQNNFILFYFILFILFYF